MNLINLNIHHYYIYNVLTDQLYLLLLYRS